MKPTPLGRNACGLLPDGKTRRPGREQETAAALLAEWLTSKDNKLFARNIANRLVGLSHGARTW